MMGDPCTLYKIIKTFNQMKYNRVECVFMNQCSYVKKGLLMKETWLKGSKQVCGMTIGPHRNKETWQWNRDVEEVVALRTRTATGCTHNTNIQHLPDEHSYFPYTSTYSSTPHNTNRKHNSESILHSTINAH